MSKQGDGGIYPLSQFTRAQSCNFVLPSMVTTLRHLCPFSVFFEESLPGSMTVALTERSHLIPESHEKVTLFCGTCILLSVSVEQPPRMNLKGLIKLKIIRKVNEHLHRA